MNGDIALMLVQDGLVTGSIYALLALAMVLVFTTTRILLVSQGEFVTFSALTFANLHLGVRPGLAWVLGGLAIVAAAMDLAEAMRTGRARQALLGIGLRLAAALAVAGAGLWLGGRALPVAAQAVLAVVLVTALGPLLYRVAFQPVAGASIRSLFVVAIALHFVLQGAGLILFGADGFRSDPMLELDIPAGPLVITGQTVLVFAVLLVLLGLVAAFFGLTLPGKALRATAVNRVGARLVGIRSRMTGQLAFTLAAFIGGVSGVLIVGLTTIYYDSGLLIGLKAVLGASCGAMVSYPVAILAALGVGVLEAFAAFANSAFTEATVFAALIPVLLWLSLKAGARDEAEEL